METSAKKEICLELRNVKKDYYVDGKPFTAIRGFSCAFPSKGFVAILGHSGSGKTTLLNIIGGLDHYTEGDMLIAGRSTKDYASRDWDNYRNKRIGFVFQSYNLISHLTVLQNVVLSLQLGGVSKKKREAKAIEVLNKVGLGEYLKKRPNQLSGGQMQRVAIARALVNDPDIILADEPTGALDSATSIQVMDLIKEVGKDRCVILVTHNRELAEEYADRIIEMKDGEILSDSDPISLEDAVHEERSVGRKNAMGFLTALASSARNLRTKKGRTALTAIACSFGIIGVALVLATSNGFSNYVSNVESSIASSVPISINPISYKTTFVPTEQYEEYPKEKEVKVYDNSNSFTTPIYNELSQTYFNYLDRMMDDPSCPAYGAAMSVMYNRSNLDFHFLAKNGDGTGEVRSINQYASVGTFGSAISSLTSLPATAIHELYGDEANMSSLYETIEGHFPKEADEMAIVVDRYNRIDFSTMKKLGYFDNDATYALLSDAEKHISFSDLLYVDAAHPGRLVYKCYPNSGYYGLPDDPKDLDSFMKTRYVDCYENIRRNAQGLLEGDPTMGPVRYLDDPDDKEIYENSAAHKGITMKIVGVLRPTKSSYLTLMPTSLAYTSKLTKIMSDDIAEGTSANALGEIQRTNWYIPHSEEPSEDGIAIMNKILLDVAKMDVSTAEGVAAAYNAVTSALPSAFHYSTVVGKARYTRISGYLGSCRNLGANFPNLTRYLPVVTSFLAGNVAEIFDPYTQNPNIMDALAYANSYSLVTSVLIFPVSLTTKDKIRNYLDDWNKSHKEVVYSDIMSDVVGGLGTMIGMISTILIVFASISLVVSSVMTAIITYVSVIERTKEIGVLRACGARKLDVSRLFESECFIVGGFAGIIGIAVTLLLCIPINVILNLIFAGNNLGSIASLNPWHALILIALSIALALISGLVPAAIASKRDPVVCLRSE